MATSVNKVVDDKKTKTNDQYYLLKYNAMAHFCLVITYGYTTILQFYPVLGYDGMSNILELWDKEFGRVSYLFGHMIISVTQLLISYEHPGSVELRNMLLGMFGHSLLIIYGLWKLNMSGVSFLDAFFLFLQGGMVYFYASNNKPDTGVIPVENRITRRDIYLFVFSCLFGYYLYMGMEEMSIKRYGLWSVAGAYLVLIYLFYSKKPKDDKKTKIL